MESSGSSFIPQRPTRGKVAAKSFRKVYVLSYVSYLVFFTTLLAVAGIFIYKLSLESNLRSLREELVAQKNLFTQSDLDRVQDLDQRITAAKQLIDSHASVHKILVALDRSIADPIQFLSFTYDRTEDPRQPRLALTAVAQQFNEVIFQEQVLSTNEIARNFEVVDVSLATQAIDANRLELGLQQVVNVTINTDLSLTGINYTGLGSPLPPLSSDEQELGNDSASLNGGIDGGQSVTESIEVGSGAVQGVSTETQ